MQIDSLEITIENPTPERTLDDDHKREIEIAAEAIRSWTKSLNELSNKALAIMLDSVKRGVDRLELKYLAYVDERDEAQ